MWIQSPPVQVSLSVCPCPCVPILCLPAWLSTLTPTCPHLSLHAPIRVSLSPSPHVPICVTLFESLLRVSPSLSVCPHPVPVCLSVPAPVFPSHGSHRCCPCASLSVCPCPCVPVPPLPGPGAARGRARGSGAPGGAGAAGGAGGGAGSALRRPHRTAPNRGEASGARPAEPAPPQRPQPRRAPPTPPHRAAPGGAEPPRRGRPGPGHALRPPRRPQPRADPGQDTPPRGQDAGAEQRLPRGGVRSRRRGQELAGAALRQGDLPRHLHPHHRGHLPAGDQLRQERVHAADHRHHRQPPVPGHAAPVHLQGPCLHPGLLGHQQAVAGGAEAHLPADRADQGQRGEHPHHAGGQQVRRDAARGGEQGGGGHGQGVEMRLHGDLGQDELQRQGALPGAAEPGEEEERQPHHRREALQQAEEDRQNQGEVQHHVEPRTGPRPLPTPDTPSRSLLPPTAGRGSGIAAGPSPRPPCAITVTVRGRRG